MDSPTFSHEELKKIAENLGVSTRGTSRELVGLIRKQLLEIPTLTTLDEVKAAYLDIGRSANEKRFVRMYPQFRDELILSFSKDVIIDLLLQGVIDMEFFVLYDFLLDDPIDLEIAHLASTLPFKDVDFELLSMLMNNRDVQARDRILQHLTQFPLKWIPEFELYPNIPSEVIQQFGPIPYEYQDRAKEIWPNLVIPRSQTLRERSIRTAMRYALTDRDVSEIVEVPELMPKKIPFVIKKKMLYIIHPDGSREYIELNNFERSSLLRILDEYEIPYSSQLRTSQLADLIRENMQIVRDV